MSTRLAEIAQRRAMLIDRAAAQRDELSGATHTLHVPITFLDRSIAFVRVLRRYSLALTLGTAVLGGTVLRKRHVWTKRILMGWQIYRRLGRRQSAE